MNNSKISITIGQTASLLEYCDGISFFVGVLRDLANYVRTLEAPLEIFEGISSFQELGELESVLGFWFSGFPKDAVYCLRETIINGSSKLRDKLLREVTSSELFTLRNLPVNLVDFLQDELHINSIDELQYTCKNGVLSSSGELSRQEELNLLEEIITLKECNENEYDDRGCDVGSLSFYSSIPKSTGDSNLLFFQNADALADDIISSLSQPWSSLPWRSSNEFVSSKTVSAFYEQTVRVWNQLKCFFSSPFGKVDSFWRKRKTFELEYESLEGNSQNSLINAGFVISKTGLLARGVDVVDRLEFLIDTRNPSIAFERIKKSDFVQEVLEEKAFSLVVTLRPNSFVLPYNNRPTPAVPLYFYAASDFVFGTRNVLFSSSKKHWNELRHRAKLRGMKLTSFGLYKGVERISSRTTERLYSKLGLSVVPEELRNGTIEWEWERNGCPELIKIQDLKGDLHLHTTYTDGSGSIDEMVAMARGLGLSYIAITDHTKNVAFVGGMNDIEFLRCWKYIDEINEQLKKEGTVFRILKGAEVDILEDGGLDLNNETLSQADWIVASIHFGKKQNSKRIQERYLDAFRNPFVDVIAHPTGRMIGMEDPIDVDLDFLCENAKKYGKCLELNSQPRRLDLNDVGLMRAKKNGVPVVISTDSHTPEQMEYLKFGILQARRAGLTSCDVLNTYSLENLLQRKKRNLLKQG